MINGADLTGKTAFDANSLNNLKQAAQENSPEAIKGVAKQFEALFMNMMLKSMRDASPKDNPFDNETSRTFTSMLDQQLSSNLASKGLGLADILAKQLSQGAYARSANSVDTYDDARISALQQAVSDDKPLSSLNQDSFNQSALIKPYANNVTNTTQPKSVEASSEFLTIKSANDKVPSDGAIEFKNRMAQAAAEASRATGLPTHLMLGQAALESGWGKRELKAADGTPSYNLFGIKATDNWDGNVVEATTTEYIHGVKQKRIEKFRAYDSYAESFKDFANMMRNNPRYENVLANLQDVNDYAQAMQKAGYATDPNYAEKLSQVIKKVSST